MRFFKSNRIVYGFNRFCRYAIREFWHTIDLVRYWTIFGWFILTWPFRAIYEWFVVGWQFRRTRDLIRGLPAVVLLIGVILLNGAARVDARALHYRYWSSARAAMTGTDKEAAEIYLQRILDDSKTDDVQAIFALGELYEVTGRETRAQWLFRKLAPDDRRGYAPAHRKRAIAMANSITSQSSSDDIRVMREQLTDSDQQQSPTMARAWAAYFLAINQPTLAIERLEQAVSEYPELSLVLGNLYLSNRQIERARTSYTSASAFLRKRLEQDPENTRLRITFASTLLKLGELDECQAVLELGAKLDPKGPYKQLLASLYTNRHDMLKTQAGVDLSVLLMNLHEALKYDPNHTAAYERLLSYSQGTTEGQTSLTEILNEVIAQGQEPGLAHFAMSILKWKEKDVPASRFHLERAYALLPEIPFIANNLAWLLATEEPVDLNRALSLIEPAVKEYPNEPRLLDTRGTIRMKLEKWNEALDDFERALQYQIAEASQTELHEKLAIVYGKLHQPELEKKHLEMVKNPEMRRRATLTRPILPSKQP